MNRQSFRHILPLLGVLTLLLSACVLCLTLVLGTDRGRQSLLDFITKTTAGPNFRLEMQGLQLGGTCILAHLTLSDAGGPWLEVTNATARPVFGELLLGRISLEHLGVEHFKMDRLPESVAGAEEDSSGFALPPMRIQSIDAERIQLGAALVGREAFLSLGGGIFIDQRQSTARLRIARLDRDRDVLELDGRIQDQALGLRLKLNEEPGGIVHEALGLNSTEGIALDVAGEGTPSDWPLTVTGRISDAASLGGNATLNFTEDPSIDLRLDLHPGPAWTGLTHLPDSDIKIRADGAWTGQDLRLTTLDLHSGFATIGANATWNNESRTLAAALRGTFADLAWIMPTTVATGPTEARADLLVEPRGLKAQGHIALKDWSLSGTPLQTASAELFFDMPAGSGQWSADTSIAAHTPSLPSGLSTWNANATLGGNATTVLLNNLRLDSERLELSATGSFDSAVHLDTDLRLRDLPILPEGSPFSARLKSSLNGQIDPGAPSLSGELSLRATEISGLPEEAELLLGQEPKMLVDFSVSPQSVEIHKGQLDSRTKGTVTGAHNLDTGLFQSGFTLALPDLQSGQLRVAHGSTLRGKASGTLQDFNLNLSAESRQILVDTLAITNTAATIALKGLPHNPAGTLRTGALVGGELAELRVQAEMQKKAVRIPECALRLPQTTLDVSGVFDPASLVFEGDARLISQDLSALGRILGTDMEGGLSAQAKMTKHDAAQTVHIQAQGSNLSALGMRVGTATLQARATPGLPGGTRADVRLDSVSYADLRADRIEGTMQGAGEGLDFDLDLAHGASDSRLKARGRFSSTPSRLHIENLQGTLISQELRLEAPLDMTFSAIETVWPQTSLAFGPARLRAKGSITAEQASISADLEGMNPALLRPLYPGLPSAIVSATLTVEGTPLDPDARLNVNAHELRTEETGLENLPDLNATAQLRLRKDSLEARASVAAASAKDLQIDANFSCPVRAELFSLTFPQDVPLAGQLQGTSELFLLPHFLNLYDQTLDGKLETNLKLSGTWGAPLIEGYGRIRNARYENFRSGTRLEALNLDAVAKDSRLDLTANGTDAGQGKLDGTGFFDPLRQTYACDVNFAACNLLRLDLIQSTASGALRFQGTYDAASLNGTLTLDPTTVRLPSSMPADMTQIEIHEINTLPSRAGVARTASSFHTDFDLNVLIPARLFVQGRGLDSEWSGKLHVGGNHAQPVLNGEMTLLRGKFDFLERTFGLAKGVLSLNGETPPNPFMDIIGEAQILDTLVQVHLNGPAKDFRLTLTSVPNLPQDELLAMILFGRSMSQISPLQAVRLAQAAAELTGIGATPDFLGKIKAGLGLQEVDVSRDEDDNTAVGVGGYFGGKYYIRTERSVSGQDRTKVEVQLTPKISVETEIGSDSRQGGGVTWKHDY